MTSDKLYLIDQVKNGIYSSPPLVPGQLSTISLIKAVGVVGSATSILINTTTFNYIPVGGY
jgi:hypothetical protein